LALKALLFLFLFLSANAFAQFTDPQDGKLDASEWLLERKGFLPVPIVITEPAVGYGAGAALLFFRESMGERAAKAKETGRFSPPDIYGVALAATENGSKFAGVGGMVTFLNDQWRYRGGVGLPDANLDFYGEGGTAAADDLKLGYNLDGIGSTQQLLRRLGDGDNFVGLRWIYLDLEARFESNRPLPAFLPQSQSVRSSGIGPVFEHDSRDNIFTPSRGWYANLEGLFYSPDIGSDEKFEIYRGRVYGYYPLSSAFVLGGRLDARTSQGDVPFYQLPYVDLRGIPVARYQDESAGAAEVELRWNVTPRWALVGFLGAGRAWGSSTSFSDADSVTSGGVGFRYLVARRLGIYMGLDVAVGPEDTAFYIQMGSAWR
jgi:Omp85 superfamily domain